MPTENFEEIEIYSVVHDVMGISPGLYQNTHLIKAGNFSEKTGYLCINQAIARDCAVTSHRGARCTWRNVETAAGAAVVDGHAAARRPLACGGN